MPGFLTDLIDRSPIPALATTRSFAEARHRVIAENVANMGTPGFKARHLDVREYQRALSEALDRRAARPAAPREITGSDSYRTDERGRLQVTPATAPRGAAFHDGTNLSVEAVERFSDLGIDRVILSKLDEALGLGVVLNCLLKVNARLSYITTGQDVPDDIEPAEPQRLAELILTGPGSIRAVPTYGGISERRRSFATATVSERPDDVSCASTI